VIYQIDAPEWGCACCISRIAPGSAHIARTDLLAGQRNPPRPPNGRVIVAVDLLALIRECYGPQWQSFHTDEEKERLLRIVPFGANFTLDAFSPARASFGDTSRDLRTLLAPNFSLDLTHKLLFNEDQLNRLVSVLCRAEPTRTKRDPPLSLTSRLVAPSAPPAYQEAIGQGLPVSHPRNPYCLLQ